MGTYPFKEIERKWRKHWEEKLINKVDLDADDKERLYVLVMFSYPSAEKLHIGHCWNYSGVDTYARCKRMQGHNVFEPMGFDAFGLPAENFAIKHGVHPAATTGNSVNLIREQIKQIGAMYDWSREVDTSKPEYYKWTQWLFLQLYNAGAAYREQAKVNWCPTCQTVLANEQVLEDGNCERCSSAVSNRNLKQWFFRITDFADDLLEGLDRIDWPESTKIKQRNWIGRSEGTEIDFQLEGHDDKVPVFTTRADTLFGVTYMVLAPEHPLTLKISAPDNIEQVKEYIKVSKNLTDIERLSTKREKSGVFTGAYAINPVNSERIPVWTADYVLGTYGTGSVMAVPAHDQRDHEFATKYSLPIRQVIKSGGGEDDSMAEQAFEDYGVMVNSGQFDGNSSKNGQNKVTQWLDDKNCGRATVNYRLRDWIISRQRYWGAPIPIIYCPKCSVVPVPEDQLPVELPSQIEDFSPKGSSPLGACKEFMETSCPKCGGEAQRDPDTMDTFVDSSWYYLRYLSTEFHDRPFDRDRVHNWLPTHVYVGGPEHATAHLIYTRYIIKFLNSQGFIDFDEPADKLVHQGIITYKGMRMSKSKGNVVNPDEFIEKYGSDCFRMYLMFMGDFTVGGDWSDDGIKGIRRFLNRVWTMVDAWKNSTDEERTEVSVCDNDRVMMHSTIKAVTTDFDRFHFNTAIARLMEFVNHLYKIASDEDCISFEGVPTIEESLDVLIKLLGPLAPHISEELWTMMGHKGTLFEQSIPNWDEAILKLDEVLLIVQINGKLIDRINVLRDVNKQVAEELVSESAKVRNKLEGKKIKKVIYVPNKIINFVVM